MIYNNKQWGKKQKSNKTGETDLEPTSRGFLVFKPHAQPIKLYGGPGK